MGKEHDPPADPKGTAALGLTEVIYENVSYNLCLWFR